jgi:hypothetical protein
VLVLALISIRPRRANAEPFVLTDNPAPPDAVVMSYDPASGFVHVKANGVNVDGDPLAMATLLIESRFHLLDLPVEPYLSLACRPGPPFFHCFDGLPREVFAFFPEGTDELPYGPILPPGLSADWLLADLGVDGTFLRSGRLKAAPGGGPYLYIVPEPTGLLMLVTGFAVLVCLSSCNGLTATSVENAAAAGGRRNIEE